GRFAERRHHVACAGAIQRVVTGSDGRIVAIGTEERVFNRYQRRAIALRDGGCVIPGCGVPAGWCEIHHVTEHARGGPTHTDNGVLLGPRGEGNRAPRRGVWGSRGDAGTTTASSTASAGSWA
ncbi:HNH nuclease, partial [Microbacterium laevaniformans OR221]